MVFAFRKPASPSAAGFARNGVVAAVPALRASRVAPHPPDFGTRFLPHRVTKCLPCATVPRETLSPSNFLFFSSNYFTNSLSATGTRPPSSLPLLYSQHQCYP